ncbi:SDR family NAD(P)-dependent oxidoreductase [Paracoccus cavernae]|uniref:SDR family NAD(P)-dependent oxidoreductase n=1 Tax=Paracoccus cavernae TaxID=1571207 RepID=A0ABT8D464_9RHOB|nr:SDR family NAD(P)-dependent oxidoreductase [Paracoccus cavernae]
MGADGWHLSHQPVRDLQPRRAFAAQSENASIINLSSVAGRVGFKMRSPYAAAKWG